MAPEDVEQALVSERLADIKTLLQQHVESDAKLLVAVQQLVALDEKRDAREEAAAEAERKRLEASEEAESKRVAAELAEQAARGAWTRETLGRFVAPVLTILGALGAAVTAWASGLFGGSHR